MARLIPAFVDDRTPSGERDVFNMLSLAHLCHFPGQEGPESVDFRGSA